MLRRHFHTKRTSSAGCSSLVCTFRRRCCFSRESTGRQARGSVGKLRRIGNDAADLGHPCCSPSLSWAGTGVGVASMCPDGRRLCRVMRFRGFYASTYPPPGPGRYRTRHACVSSGSECRSIAKTRRFQMSSGLPISRSFHGSVTPWSRNCHTRRMARGHAASCSCRVRPVQCPILKRTISIIATGIWLASARVGLPSKIAPPPHTVTATILHLCRY